MLLHQMKPAPARKSKNRRKVTLSQQLASGVQGKTQC